MTCEACETAKTKPRGGVYFPNCYGCQVRSIANAPRHIREIAYRNRHASEREQFKADVAAAYRRMQGNDVLAVISADGKAYIPD